MKNGTPLIKDLVRDRAYQEELIRLMRALTVEGADGRLREAKNEREAFYAIVKFRARHGLPLLDCDPLYYVAGLHRARIRHVAMTAAEVNYSEHWLIRRGLSCNVDNEFNPKPGRRTK